MTTATTTATTTNGHAAAPPPQFDEWLKEVLARVVAHIRDEFDDKLATIKSKYASDIAELQSKRRSEMAELKKQFNVKLAQIERRHNREIANLKDKKAAANRPISWKMDCPRFRAIPFYSDGKPGAAINLGPLFAQYNDEVTS